MSFYPRLKLFEVSASDIIKYVGNTGNSMVLLDQTDDDIIKKVDTTRRSDKLSKEKIESFSPKLQNYIDTFLKSLAMSIDQLDGSDIDFGDFWDFQVDLYKGEKTQKNVLTKQKKLNEYTFDEEVLEILNQFFDSKNKLQDWKTFIQLVPSGLIKQPLNELFTLMVKIISSDGSIIKDEIKGQRLVLDKSEQTKWENDFANYLYSFKEIEEINKGSFYKDEIRKPGTFLYTLFNINETGIGRGEMMLCYMFEGAKASGGGQSFDVILLNGTTYEVKEYVANKQDAIRLGTEGKLTRFKFWFHLQKSVMEAQSLFEDYKDELKKNIKPFFYKIWEYVADDEQKEGSYNKAVSAGIAAGELGDANLNILKMWYYLAHEFVTSSHKYIDLPDEILDTLSRMHYVNEPDQLEEDLNRAAEQYFNQNKDLDLFIVFRPDKVNIVDKEGFSFKTITQAGVKFLETDLTNKDIRLAKIAFKKWKDSVQKTIKEFEDKEDKESLRDVLRGVDFEDFYDKEQEGEFDERYKRKQSELKKKKYEKELKNWQGKKATAKKTADKLKDAQKRIEKFNKWLIDNPEPLLQESYYPRLFN